MNLHLVSAWIAALFAFAAPAQATSFYIQPFTDFVKAAPNIVRGNLHDIIVENGITADGAKTIYTYATLDIKESLKGSISKPTIRIRKIGGTKDGVTLEVPSSPDFVESEDTVVFLGPAREDQSYEVWGLELGKFWLKEEDGDFVLKGGILDYAPSDEHGNNPHADATPIAENQRTWTLSQLRELAANPDRGTKAAPSPAVQSNAASPEAKETKQPNATIQPNSAETSAAEDESTDRQSPPLWAFVLVGAIAVGIFFYFKNRG